MVSYRSNRKVTKTVFPQVGQRHHNRTFIIMRLSKFAAKNKFFFFFSNVFINPHHKNEDTLKSKKLIYIVISHVALVTLHRQAGLQYINVHRHMNGFITAEIRIPWRKPHTHFQVDLLVQICIF